MCSLQLPLNRRSLAVFIYSDCSVWTSTDWTNNRLNRTNKSVCILSVTLWYRRNAGKCFFMDLLGFWGICAAAGWNKPVALADFTIMSLILKGRKSKSPDALPCWSEHVSFERGEIGPDWGIIYERWGPSTRSPPLRMCCWLAGNKPHLPGEHQFNPTWRRLNYSRCVFIILPDL